jgi:DNA-binding CsgD family transcriptional regulator
MMCRLPLNRPRGDAERSLWGTRCEAKGGSFRLRLARTRFENRPLTPSHVRNPGLPPDQPRVRIVAGRSLQSPGDPLYLKRRCGRRGAASRSSSARDRGVTGCDRGSVDCNERHLARSRQHLEVPYDAARARILLGIACRSLGDTDTAALESRAARSVFEQLGAAPDLARLDTIERGEPPSGPEVLTSRELQVLRLVAAGKTNKSIARELSLSERTVDRHASNILTKLNVSSRTAAITHAYDHKLF